jgi:cobalt-zinc-cadmium efflux system membrane fusion protein
MNKGTDVDRDWDDATTAPVHRRRHGWWLVLLAAIGLLAVGVAAGTVWTERRLARVRGDVPTTTEASPAAGVPAGDASGAKVTPEPSEPVEVSLTPEALQRAGIRTAVVRAEIVDATVTVPGTVTSNAYRDTKVNALVGGIVREVRHELGAPVRRDEPIAVIFSNDLADAQMRYLSMQATLAADHQKLERTRKLADIGAASRQELEEVTAVHAAHATEVAAYRQRLFLLGIPPAQVARLQSSSDIVSELTVVAPLDGVVISRSVNPGQVIAAGQELFVITDLSVVWVIGDLYERDFATVRAGIPAAVTVPSLGDRSLRGRVAYIDPRVDAATRTAKVRVEVPNPNMALRLGMFVQVAFQTGGGQRRTLVPRAAIQTVGERSVVYVPADEEGRFIERTVKLGAIVGDYIQIEEGVKAGERVATEGSFLLRAEAARTRSGS